MCKGHLLTNLSPKEIRGGDCKANMSMITMIYYWFTHDAPHNIRDVQLNLLVISRSYIPPDRIQRVLQRRIQ